MEIFTSTETIVDEKRGLIPLSAYPVFKAEQILGVQLPFWTGSGLFDFIVG